MQQYKADFWLPNGTRTQQIVTASSTADAKKIVEAQFGKVRFFGVNPVPRT